MMEGNNNKKEEQLGSWIRTEHNYGFPENIKIIFGFSCSFIPFTAASGSIRKYIEYIILLNTEQDNRHFIYTWEKVKLRKQYFTQTNLIKMILRTTNIHLRKNVFLNFVLHRPNLWYLSSFRPSITIYKSIKTILAPEYLITGIYHHLAHIVLCHSCYQNIRKEGQGKLKLG